MVAVVQRQEPECVRIGDCVLYHADWRDICIPSDVSLVLTDPPYGIDHPVNFKARGRGLRPGHWVESLDFDPISHDDEAFNPTPLLTIGRQRVLWGANWYASRLPDSGGWLVWDKMRPDDLDQATCELAWTDCVKGVRRFSHLWDGMRRHSERCERYHPMAKPVALFSWILGLKWIDAGKVFDPFMGASPVGVACARAGLPYVGVEKVRSYFDVACERIDAESRQGRLAL